MDGVPPGGESLSEFRGYNAAAPVYGIARDAYFHNARRDGLKCKTLTNNSRTIGMLHHPMNTMTSRIRLACIAILLVALSAPSTAEAQLGVAAGLNFESIDDIQSTNGRATFDNASGYHVGVIYDLGLGPAGLRVGLFYRDIGDVDVSLSGVSDAFDVSMIDIPVDLRFNLTATPVIRPYVIAGPVFSFPSTGDSQYDDALEDVSVSGNVGVGLAIDALGVKITPEFRYAIGVSRFMKENASIGNVSFAASDVQRLNSVMLRVGIIF